MLGKIVRAIPVALMLWPASIWAEPASPREVWPQATAATDSGDYTVGEQKLTELLETGKALGIRRFPLFADSAIGLAHQANAQNNRQTSDWAFKAANRLDPDSPSVAFASADLARNQSKWADAIGRVFVGFGRAASDYTASTLAWSDLLVTLSAALMLLVALFAIILFLRHNRKAAHDFREVIGRKFSAGITTVLAFAILFTPIFLWLGPIWLILFWFALFFPYAGRAERAMIIILLVIASMLPLAISWAAYRAAGVDNPVVRAAVASEERSYNPETLRRMRDVVEKMPEQPFLHMLLGNLLVQEGNEQEAALHYRRSIELNDKIAGAHVNLGNLHFFDNDFVAAMTEYEKAQAIDKNMALAYYNQSVAAGELYRYDLQGQKLAEAKTYDRGLVDRLVASPPAQKVVKYNMPIAQAWDLAEKVTDNKAASDVFGNFARFDAGRALLNPVSIGALLSLIGALVHYAMRRRNGVAGSCIKCGRTFCQRCKSSRESAIYCTQCIHIYLKRDGVSVDTKRAKLAEVHQYQNGLVRTRKIMSTFFPGTSALLEGSTFRGVLVLLLFLIVAMIGLLVGRLAPIGSPAEMMKLVVRSLSAFMILVLWLIVTVPVYRQKATA